MGVGTNPNCSTALHNPNDTQRQVVCLADNVGLLSIVNFFFKSQMFNRSISRLTFVTEWGGPGRVMFGVGVGLDATVVVW